VAVCIAVTALPVLAAILREMGLIGTRLGQTALALAAVNDAALWLVLAVLLALAAGSAAEVLATLGLAALWLGVMVGVVRPLLARLAAGEGAEERMLVAAVATAIASAASAEAIGIGYIIGAFAAGTLMPLRCRAALLARLEPVAATILLPFFFMATGLKALIEPGEPVFLALLALATLATVAGKVVGTALPARAAGEPWSFALALGALMQAKGLMEVVVLAVLHDAGLIGTTLFSVMVAMAMVCTVIAAPLTRLTLARGGRGVGAFSVGGCRVMAGGSAPCTPAVGPGGPRSRQCLEPPLVFCRSAGEGRDGCVPRDECRARPSPRSGKPMGPGPPGPGRGVRGARPPALPRPRPKPLYLRGRPRPIRSRGRGIRRSVRCCRAGRLRSCPSARSVAA
jgi:hypothetical protein